MNPLACRLSLLFTLLLAMGACSPKADPLELFRAAEKGDKAKATELLDAGVAVDVRNQFGNTALHYAAASNQPEIVKLLLDRGADVKAEDKDGRTAIEAARDKRHEDVIRLLVAAGAE